MIKYNIVNTKSKGQSEFQNDYPFVIKAFLETGKVNEDLYIRSTDMFTSDEDAAARFGTQDKAQRYLTVDFNEKKALERFKKDKEEEEKRNSYKNIDEYKSLYPETLKPFQKPWPTIELTPQQREELLKPYQDMFPLNNYMDAYTDIVHLKPLLERCDNLQAKAKEEEKMTETEYDEKYSMKADERKYFIGCDTADPSVKETTIMSLLEGNLIYNIKVDTLLASHILEDPDFTEDKLVKFIKDNDINASDNDTVHYLIGEMKDYIKNSETKKEVEVLTVAQKEIGKLRDDFTKAHQAIVNSKDLKKIIDDELMKNLKDYSTPWYCSDKVNEMIHKEIRDNVSNPYKFLQDNCMTAKITDNEKFLLTDVLSRDNKYPLYNLYYFEDGKTYHIEVNALFESELFKHEYITELELAYFIKENDGEFGNTVSNYVKELNIYGIAQKIKDKMFLSVNEAEADKLVEVFSETFNGFNEVMKETKAFKYLKSKFPTAKITHNNKFLLVDLTKEDAPRVRYCLYYFEGENTYYIDVAQLLESDFYYYEFFTEDNLANFIKNNDQYGATEKVFHPIVDDLQTIADMLFQNFEADKRLKDKLAKAEAEYEAEKQEAKEEDDTINIQSTITNVPSFNSIDVVYNTDSPNVDVVKSSPKIDEKTKAYIDFLKSDFGEEFLHTMLTDEKTVDTYWKIFSLLNKDTDCEMTDKEFENIKFAWKQEMKDYQYMYKLSKSGRYLNAEPVTTSWDEFCNNLNKNGRYYDKEAMMTSWDEFCNNLNKDESFLKRMANSWETAMTKENERLDKIPKTPEEIMLKHKQAREFVLQYTHETPECFKIVNSVLHSKTKEEAREYFNNLYHFEDEGHGFLKMEFDIILDEMYSGLYNYGEAKIGSKLAENFTIKDAQQDLFDLVGKLVDLEKEVHKTLITVRDLYSNTCSIKNTEPQIRVRTKEEQEKCGLTKPSKEYQELQETIDKIYHKTLASEIVSTHPNDPTDFANE